MSPPSWHEVLRGRNAYNESPEIERYWVRQALCAGVLLGVFITILAFYLVN